MNVNIKNGRLFNKIRNCIMQEFARKIVSPEEYFDLEETAEYKSEYYHGEIFAMTGAYVEHNLIAMNTGSALHVALRNSDCVVFPPDIKVRVDEARHYTYPDVTVVCGDIEYAGNRDDVISNPLVIMEILSESSKDYDRGSKFTAYRKIESLKDYILIDQYERHVEYYSKIEKNKWILEEYKAPDDTIKIKSINVELSLKDIYHGIHF